MCFSLINRNLNPKKNRNLRLNHTWNLTTMNLLSISRLVQHLFLIFKHQLNPGAMKFLLLPVFLTVAGLAFAQGSTSIHTAKPAYTQDPANKLLPRTDTLELKYIIWGCECPNWIPVTDFKRSETNGLIEHCIYLESVTKTLPLDFDPEIHILQVIGHFYEKEDYPDTLLNSEEPVRKARIFQFSAFQVVKI